MHIPRGVGLRARLIEAVDRDRRVVGGSAVELDVHRLAADPRDGYARHGLEELADAAIGGRAEFVGGDDLAHVGGEALIIDGDRRAIHVAGRGDDELAEFYRAGARRGVFAEGAEVEILAEALTRVDDNGRGFRSESCVENPDTSGAGGHARKCVEAQRVGERGQAGPIDGDAGALENLAVGGEGHEAGEGAGARCGSVGGRGKRTEDQCE